MPPFHNSIFFNFQNVTYIQNEGFPTAVLGTAPVTAVARAFTVQGGESKYYYVSQEILNWHSLRHSHSA